MSEQTPKWVEDPKLYALATQLHKQGTLSDTQYEAYRELDKHTHLTADHLKTITPQISAIAHTAAKEEVIKEHIQNDAGIVVGATFGGAIGGGAVGSLGAGIGMLPGAAIGGVLGLVSSVGVKGFNELVDRDKTHREIQNQTTKFTNDMQAALTKITAAEEALETPSQSVGTRPVRHVHK